MTSEITASDLTPAERAGLTSGLDAWQSKPIPRLGISAVRVADGPHGLRVEREGDGHIDLANSIPATCFPPAVSLGSTWNAGLMEQVGRALGDESAALGVGVLLGPGINIKRSPLCGRNFEYFSEDPHLTGILAASLVRGIQSRGVGAAVKHFAANNQETDRMRVNVEVDDRTLREIYLRAFEIVVREAQPWMLMSSYNFLNGVAMSDNAALLTGILREEWGFDGVVVSDWGAVYDRVASVEAGLDLEMPTTNDVRDREVVAAVESGALDLAILDLAVERMLLLERRVRAAIATPVEEAANDELAMRVAVEAAVLLRNEGGLLPLSSTQRIAVIGDFAESPRYQGAGSSRVNATMVSAPLDAIRELAPVTFSPGFRRDGGDGDLGAAAVEAAAAADVAVLFLGLSEREESEGFDRTTLSLPQEQLDLLAAVAATGTPVVVVLANGGVVTVADWQHHAAAVLETWLPGQAGGRAIARLLFGLDSPSGRLAETIPLRLEHTPSFHGFPGYNGVVRYGEGVFVGYRHYESAAREVAYPFGFGLGYSSFEQRIVSAATAGEADSLTIELTVEVRNTGSVTAKEVVQVYVEPPAGLPTRPMKELRAFRKIELLPGQSQQLRIDLDSRDLAFWDERVNDWTVVTGAHVIHIGESARVSADTAVIEVRGHDRPVPITATSTLREWQEHPIGGAVLAGLPGVATFIGEDAKVEELTLRMLENIPLVKLALMFEFGISAEQLDEAVTAANGG